MSYGLARMMGGINQGMEDLRVRNIQDQERAYQQERRATMDQREDTAYAQSQDDRGVKLQRQAMETEQLENMQTDERRMRAGNDALREYMSTKDPQHALDYLNEYSPDGIEFEAITNEDGTLTGRMTKDGQVVGEKPLTEDVIGPLMIQHMSKDPYADIKENQSLARSAAAKKTEMEHDLDKIRVKGEEDRKTEQTKLGIGGRGGKVPDADKELNKISDKAWTTLSATGLMAAFDDTNKARMKDAHFSLSRMYYYTDHPNIADAPAAAGALMQKLQDKASQQADAEVEAGTLDPDNYNNKVSDIIYEYVQQAIKQRVDYNPGGQAGLVRTGGQGGQAKTGDKGLDAYIAAARKRAPAGMDDETIVKKATARYNQRNKGQEAAPGAVPGISDAGADEAPAAGDTALKRPSELTEEATPDKKPAPDKKPTQLTDEAQPTGPTEEEAAETERRKEQRSGVSEEYLEKTKKKNVSEGKAAKGKAAAKREQDKALRRYRRLAPRGRAKTMGKKDLALALLSATSKKEKDAITRELQKFSKDAR